MVEDKESRKLISDIVRNDIRESVEIKPKPSKNWANIKLPIGRYAEVYKDFMMAMPSKKLRGFYQDVDKGAFFIYSGELNTINSDLMRLLLGYGFVASYRPGYGEYIFAPAGTV